MEKKREMIIKDGGYEVTNAIGRWKISKHSTSFTLPYYHVQQLGDRQHALRVVAAIRHRFKGCTAPAAGHAVDDRPGAWVSKIWYSMGINRHDNHMRKQQNVCMWGYEM